MAFEAPKKLVFLHIPKTAGSSVGQFFDAQYLPTQICHIYNGNVKEQLQSALAEDSIRFIRGHFGLYKALLEQLPNPDIFVFTFLREPILRVISLYNHMQRMQSEGHKNRMQDVHSLSDFLALKTDYNEQTRYLSGIQNKALFLENPEQGFKNALQNLEQLNFIGLNEWMKEDFTKLCSMLGIAEKIIRHENKGLSNLKQKLLFFQYKRTVAEHELWDIKIYESLKKKRK